MLCSKWHCELTESVRSSQDTNQGTLNSKQEKQKQFYAFWACRERTNLEIMQHFHLISYQISEEMHVTLLRNI